MIALITQREIKTYNKKSDQLEESYISYFEKKGINLVPIPNNTNNFDFYLGLHPSLIILSGGGDIDPQKLCIKKQNFPCRELIERNLLDYASKNKTPVLGICRGMQAINYYFGGELIKLDDPESHVAKDHYVYFTDHFGRKLGKKAKVNSFHNYGITKKDLSKSLEAIASTEQGVIEAVYHPNLPILGLEWHPERLSPDDKINDLIIDSFLAGGLFK